MKYARFRRSTFKRSFDTQFSLNEPTTRYWKEQLRLRVVPKRRGRKGYIVKIVYKLINYIYRRLTKLTSPKRHINLAACKLKIFIRHRGRTETLPIKGWSDGRRTPYFTRNIPLKSPTGRGNLFVEFWHHLKKKEIKLLVLQVCKKIPRYIWANAQYIGMEANKFVACHIKRWIEDFDMKEIEETTKKLVATGKTPEDIIYEPTTFLDLCDNRTHPVKRPVPKVSCSLGNKKQRNGKNGDGKVVFQRYTKDAVVDVSRLRQTHIEEFFKPRRLMTTTAMLTTKSSGEANEERDQTRALPKATPAGNFHQHQKPSIKDCNKIRLNLLRYYSRNSHKDGAGGTPKKYSSKRSYWTTLAAVGMVAPNYGMPPGQPTQPAPQQRSQQNPFGQFPNGPYIDWNLFCYGMLAKGEVERIVVDPTTNSVRVVLFDGAIINGIRPFMKQYLLQVPSLELFEKKLREFERSLNIAPGNQVPVIYERSTSTQAIVATLLIAGILYFISRNARISGPQSIISSFSKAKYTLVDPASRSADSSSIRFRDVAGLKEAKVEIMEFVDYLKNSERFLELGAKLPKGVLLTGPPGCGKTLLAKAVATEANVPFLALSGSDFIEMIGGVGASRVRSLFKSANKLAPCIVYIDEIDSIGKKRSGSAVYNGEMEQTLNQLLVEMDGMVTRKGVILLASTNRADVLDAALTRPGRFDRQILIDLPNLEERREIFEKHASKIKLDIVPSEIAKRIAQLTPGMSGADLANVCNEAALHAARRDKTAVSSDDLEYAIERVVGGTEKRTSSMSPEEKRIIAYHESGHALVGWLLEHTEEILKVSIVPRTSNVLGFAQYLPSDQKLYTKQQILDKMCMALGGRVAELIKFNHLSTGAQDDIKRVTQMAMAQIKEYGFDPVIGNISFPKEDTEQGAKKPYSKRLANIIDTRAGVMVREAFDRTLDLLNGHIDKLDILAETLLAKEVINSSDIEKLIGPRPYKKESIRPT